MENHLHPIAYCLKPKNYRLLTNIFSLVCSPVFKSTTFITYMPLCRLLILTLSVVGRLYSLMILPLMSVTYTSYNCNPETATLTLPVVLGVGNTVTLNDAPSPLTDFISLILNLPWLSICLSW